MSLHYLGKREPRKLSPAMLGIRRDHLRRRVEIKFCIVAGLQDTDLRFKFHQNRLSGFGCVCGGG